MKFKIGDKIIVVKENVRKNHLKIGATGTIVGIDDYCKNGIPIRTVMDNSSTNYNYCFEEQLMVARIKDTKIARLVHKDRISRIEDGWLWLGSK